MHKGGKKLASKYKVGTFDPCLNHISISWSWTPKGKLQCWAKYMFYHISIYDNGIEFFTFFQYKNDIGIKF